MNDLFGKPTNIEVIKMKALNLLESEKKELLEQYFILMKISGIQLNEYTGFDAESVYHISYCRNCYFNDLIVDLEGRVFFIKTENFEQYQDNYPFAESEYHEKEEILTTEELIKWVNNSIKRFIGDKCICVE